MAGILSDLLSLVEALLVSTGLLNLKGEVEISALPDTLPDAPAAPGLPAAAVVLPALPRSETLGVEVEAPLILVR